jgi:hypothetical protein
VPTNRGKKAQKDYNQNRDMENMDAGLAFALIPGIVVALLVGLIVYRDATNRKLAHNTIWALSVGSLSGIGAVLATWFAVPVQRTLRDAISGNEYIAASSPFEVPLTGLALELLIVLLIVSIYRMSTNSGSTMQAR